MTILVSFLPMKLHFGGNETVSLGKETVSLGNETMILVEKFGDMEGKVYLCIR